MYLKGSINHKITPGVQITADKEFLAGYYIDKLDEHGRVLSHIFTQKTKAQITEDLKAQYGFKTKMQELMDEMIENMEID